MNCFEDVSERISLLSLAVMDGSVHLFQCVRNYYHTMGLYTPQSNQTRALNIKTLSFLLSMIVLFLSCFGYFLLKAQNILDYGQSFYGSMTDIYSLLDCMITIWRMPVILKLIGMCEQTIENRECI